MKDSASPAGVELLFFRIGEALYGADASQVLRIGRPDSKALAVRGLAAPDEARRALVFSAGGVEAQLAVDAVEGVRAVAVGELRRMPETALAGAYTVGVWLDGSTLVPLLDLSELWTRVAGEDHGNHE